MSPQFQFPITDSQTVSGTSKPYESPSQLANPQAGATKPLIKIKVDDGDVLVIRELFEPISAVIRTKLADADEEALGVLVIRIRGLQVEDMQKFLAYCYLKGSTSFDVSVYHSILKVASILEMRNVFDKALEKLDGLLVDPFERLRIAISYNVKLWICQAVLSIIQREAPLSREEVEVVGEEVGVILSFLRETRLESSIRVFHSNANKSPCVGLSAFCGQDKTDSEVSHAEVLIRKYFDIPDDKAGSGDHAPQEVHDSHNEKWLRPGTNYQLIQPDFVKITVDDGEFTVPQQIYESLSPVFRDLFVNELNTAGNWNRYNLNMSNISKEQFVHFWDYTLAPSNTYDNPKHLEDVLHVAIECKAESIIPHVVIQLGNIIQNPVEMYRLGRRYSVDEWLFPSLLALACRLQSISLEEVKVMGVDHAFKVAAVRQVLKANRLDVVRQQVDNALPNAACPFCGTKSHKLSKEEIPDDANDQLQQEIWRLFPLAVTDIVKGSQPQTLDEMKNSSRWSLKLFSGVPVILFLICLVLALSCTPSSLSTHFPIPPDDGSFVDIISAIHTFFSASENNTCDTCY